MYGNAIKINDKVTFPYVLNMNKFMKEDIATKIKQTEDKMNDEDQQENAPVIVAEETEEEKRQRNIDEVNQKLDAMIENSKEKEDLENKEMSVEDTHHSGPKDVEMIDDEGIDYSDPMNSLAGPKEYVYGLDDDNHVDYSLRGDAVGSNKTKLIDLSFKPRDETEILAEIDRDIKDYVQQGEWVYYLYSVLIHSGGVGGGHYSAYIRSFEDKQWYHFNDSKVSEISSGRIEEMYGDGSSSKNAYLVIYKKYKLKETNSSLEVDEASNPVITDDEIPDYIKEEVEIDNNAFRQEEIEREKEQAEQKERLSHITLRFYSKVHREERSTAEIYSNKVALDDPNVLLDEKKYDFKNYYTIKQAHEDAYKLYGLESKGIAFENTQLRMYSVAFKILKQSFEDSYEKTLQDLGINMSTPLFLETKLPNEIFESLSPDVIPIRYYLWTEGLVSLDEQFLTHHRLFINKNNTLRDLQQDILVNMTEKEILQGSQTLENIILYKEKYTNTGVSLNELTLPDQLNRTIDSLNITEGNRIFVDFRGDSDSKTNWEKEFTQHENRYQINFNNPFNGSPDQWANDEYRSFESTYNNTVFLEYQQTCLEMKQAISSVLNLNIDEFKIMTAGIRYEEIRDLSQTLCEAGLYKNSRIFVELGTPTHAGAIKVLIYEAIFNHDEDNELFKYSDLLFELNVGKDFSVREFKAMVAKEYQHRFMPDATEELHRDRIRIRDKGVERLGKIMRDGRKIHEYGICNNKVYAIQILDYEESIVDDNDIMLVVREWNPNNITGALTKKKEILLNRKFRHHEITEALKNQGLIPDEGVNVEDYDICKVNSISKFMVEDLPHEKWTKLNSNGGFTALEGAPLYIRSDGYLVIIRNREYFKAAPIINDADMPLPVGSIYDAVSSKYDKFDIKSSAHRLPYVGGKAPQQKGMTIKVIS